MYFKETIRTNNMIRSAAEAEYNVLIHCIKITSNKRKASTKEVETFSVLPRAYFSFSRNPSGVFVVCKSVCFIVCTASMFLIPLLHSALISREKKYSKQRNKIQLKTKHISLSSQQDKLNTRQTPDHKI